MASLMKTVVSLPLRFPSSLFLLSLLFFLLLYFVLVSPLLLMVAAVVGGAAGDKAKWWWRSFQQWRERNQRERWVTVLLLCSFVFLFFPSIFLSAQVFPSLFVSTLFSKQSMFISQTIPCFLLSIRFFSSSSFPKSFAPSGFLFFLFLPRFRSLLPSFLQKIYPPLPPYFVFFSFMLFSFLFSYPFSLENPLFRSSFLFCIRAVFIGAGGAGSTLPRPIIYMGCEAAAPPCHGTGWDVQWGRRLQDTAPLFSHHEEVQVASGFGFNRARGRGMRGREKQGKKTKTSLPLLHVQGKKKEKQCGLKTTLFCYFFFYFLKNAWNRVVFWKITQMTLE